MTKQSVAEKPEVPQQISLFERKLQKFLAAHEIERRDYDLCPKIQDFALKFFGSINELIEMLKFSTDPEVRKFLEFYWGLKPNLNERYQIPLEAIVLAADINPHLILGAAFMVSQHTISLESKFKTIKGHPEIVDKTLKIAKTAKGTREREMVHKAVGWLPSPKGSSINVNLFGPQGHHFGSPSEHDPNTIDGSSLDAVFGHDAQELEEWSERRVKILEAGK